MHDLGQLVMVVIMMMTMIMIGVVVVINSIENDKNELNGLMLCHFILKKPYIGVDDLCLLLSQSER